MSHNNGGLKDENVYNLYEPVFELIPKDCLQLTSIIPQS